MYLYKYIFTRQKEKINMGELYKAKRKNKIVMMEKGRRAEQRIFIYLLICVRVCVCVLQ